MIVTPFNVILFGVVALLGVGFYGLLITRNLIKVVMVLQILIKGVVLALVLAGAVGGNAGLGQSTAATVIVADTIVAVVGLALAVQASGRAGSWIWIRASAGCEGELHETEDGLVHDRVVGRCGIRRGPGC